MRDGDDLDTYAEKAEDVLAVLFAVVVHAAGNEQGQFSVPVACDLFTHALLIVGQADAGAYAAMVRTALAYIESGLPPAPDAAVH